MRRAVGTIPGATTYLTGQAAIEHDLDPVFNEDLKVGELYIAIPIATVLLVFVFGTLAFLIPLLFAAAAIPVTLGIIWIFANSMELTTYIQNMVMLIGLGIAVDYSLLVVYRYREELRRGDSKEEAIVRTIATAGRAVVFSGTAVAIGLGLLLFMPLPFMRGFGVGGLFIPIVSIVCALTLLPVLLYFIGAKLDSVRLLPRAVIGRREDEDRNFWVRLSRAIMRRPVVFAAATIVLLAVGVSVSGAPSLLVPVGIGVTAYGAAYLLVHDVVIHRRLVFLPVPDALLRPWREAHNVHHLFARAPYGFLAPVVPPELRRRAAERGVDRTCRTVSDAPA
jgi:RND superfamily putative drug exporter